MSGDSRFGDDRPPAPQETCCVSEPHLWKRDALLFDKIYVPSHWYHTHGYVEVVQDVPEELVFSFRSVDEELDRAECAAIGSIGYGGPIGWCPNRFLAASCLEIGISPTPTYESLPMFYTNFESGLKMAYDAALSNLPLVDTAQVNSKEILEFMSDPEAVRKYRDLKLWLHYVLKAESVDHATNLIAQKIDDYAWSIRKHGLKTKIGAFTQVIDWKKTPVVAAAAAGAATVAGPVFAAIVAGLGIAGQIAAFFGERLLDLQEVERGPNREVAILYDAQRKFGHH